MAACASGKIPPFGFRHWLDSQAAWRAARRRASRRSGQRWLASTRCWRAWRGGQRSLLASLDAREARLHALLAPLPGVAATYTLHASSSSLGPQYMKDSVFVGACH